LSLVIGGLSVALGSTRASASFAATRTGVGVSPTDRTRDEVANAIDGSTETGTYTTTSYTLAKPAYLMIDLAPTVINHLRLYKDTAAAGSHTLQIEYTSGSGSLEGRTWNAVTSMTNGVAGSELLNASSVNSDGSIIGDVHDSGVSGFASLMFDTVEATGVRIGFTGAETYNHFHVFEVEAYYTDLTAPTTTFDVQPEERTTSTDAHFEFTSNEEADFECKLDDEGFAACSSPQDLTGVSEGAHTFSVRGTDGSGNVEDPPAVATWTVDTTGPTVNFDASPPEFTNSSDAHLGFSSPDEDLEGFTCALNGASPTACSSPQDLSGLGEGSYTFEVEATDDLGNTASSSVTWAVDTTKPDTQITGAPNDPTGSTSAQFFFTSTEASSTFVCQLDTAVEAPCASGDTFAGLAHGEHTLTVTAIDRAGNRDDSPASYTWNVDTVGPTVTIDSHPPKRTSKRKASFTFSSADAGAVTFECALDGADFAPCTSPFLTPRLKSKKHKFQVQGTDELGNTGPIAKWVWTVT
jgi:hypothetical protein